MGQREESYRLLALLALVGAGLVVLLGRLLRPKGGQENPLVESIDPHQALDEPIEAPPFERPEYATPRARVIRAYERFLERARERGWKLPGHNTAREIQGRIQKPEAPLERLTALFMDARYGPAEPSDAEVRDAEGASRTLAAHLLGRRGR
jgi:hypothetical protein